MASLTLMFTQSVELRQSAAMFILLWRCTVSALSFEVPGLEPTASLGAVNWAYRTLAKQFHPDKDNDPDTKSVFQCLKHAYRILLNQLRTTSDTTSRYLISLLLWEKTLILWWLIFCICYFLTFLMNPRSNTMVLPPMTEHILQLHFPYTNANDKEHYVSLSLTFYPTLSRLLVQGLPISSG